MSSRTHNVAVAARAFGVAIGLVAAEIVVSSVALGWLYWLRAHVVRIPGPKVTDALPLDELPGHAAVSLALYVVVFAIAGLLLGLVARAFRLNRLSATLAVGIGTGAWLYLVAAVSIFVVRQDSFDMALDAARGLESVYLAATLCALGGALLAHRPTKGYGTATIAVSVVAVLGAINLLNGILPPRQLRHGVFGLLSHPGATPLERTFGIVTGVLLLLASRALGRRSRPAWTTAVGLVVATLVVYLVAGFATAPTALAIVTGLFLLARRHDFGARGDPTARPSALLRLLGMFAAAFVFGMTALVINRSAANLPVRLLPVLRTTLFAFAGMTPRGARLISGGFAQWFPWSVLAIAVSGLVWAATTYFAPWRARHRVDLGRWQLAQEIVRTSGTDSLAPFVLRADKSLFLYPDDAVTHPPGSVVLIAYRVVRGVAIVSGDPIGPELDLEKALSAFLEFLGERGWRLAVIGASDRCLEIYDHLGLRALYHGDEAVIDTAGFSLAGGGMKTVRQAAHRVRRKGYACEIRLGGEVTTRTRSELVGLQASWLEYRPPKGFVMEFDELFRLDGDDVLFAIARSADGSVVGFLEFAVCHAVHSLSLSSMPRRSDAPNGLNAFLITETVSWAAANDYTSVSLNFSPFARLLDRHAELSFTQQIERAALRVAKSLLSLQLDNLLMFNRRFSPNWQARYVVYERRRDLPRIAVAAMAAEHYLPFADRLRGRDWMGGRDASNDADDDRADHQ